MMGCVCVTLCNIALRSGVIGNKLPQKLGSTNGLAPGTHMKISEWQTTPIPTSWGALDGMQKNPNMLLFLTKYCVWLHNPHHSLSYTYGKFWAWRSQWCTPFFMFFVFSHCIFVFRKKYIFLFFWPNLTYQNCELPRKVYKPNLSKNCWFRLFSASLGEKSRSPTEVVSGPV